MALLLFGQQSNGRLTEMVRSSALPRVHAICTCRGTGYARDGMPEGLGTRNDRSHRKCAGADGSGAGGSGADGCSGRCTFEADASSPVDYVSCVLELVNDRVAVVGPQTNRLSAPAS